MLKRQHALSSHFWFRLVFFRSFDFAAIAAKLPAASVNQFNGLRVQHQGLKSK
jgi:hypothetical protein